MLLRLIRPPRLRTTGVEGEIRRATWMELFYDLVFVVAVAQLGNSLSEDHSFVGVLEFVALFIPVWWAWVGHTIYAARFDTDDLIHRLGTAAMMLAAAAMAVQIPTALEGGSAGFAAAYVCARTMLLLLYLGVRFTIPEARGVSGLYLTGFSIGAALWAISILVPPPARFALWTLGLAIDFATPWIGRHTGVLRRFPLDTSHLPERFGLFTIIVLGETILSVVSGMSKVDWRIESIVTAALAFSVAMCIWWIYFTFVEEAPFLCNLGSGQSYIYVHLPIVIGVVVIGIGMKYAIIEASHQTLTPDTLLLTGAGIGLWISAFLALLIVSVQRLPLARAAAVYAAAIAATVVVLALGTFLTPPLTLAGICLVFVALVLVDEYSWTYGRDTLLPDWRQNESRDQEK
jgi:low temperature requirement protein LtrA